MNPITTKAELKEKLENLMQVEIKARDSYKEDLITFSNFKLKDVIKTIKEDEDKHIRLLDELIFMLN